MHDTYMSNYKRANVDTNIYKHEMYGKKNR